MRVRRVPAQPGRARRLPALQPPWRYFMDTTSTGDPVFACHPWTLPERQHLTSFVGNRGRGMARPLDPDAGQPFFLHVGFLAPHSPTMPPPDYFVRTGCDGDAPRGVADPKPWLADARRGYRAMITHLDRYVGAIRECLAERGLLENTIIVYTADHGEMAGDHGAPIRPRSSRRACASRSSSPAQGSRRATTARARRDARRRAHAVRPVRRGAPRARPGASLAPLLPARRDTHRETVYVEMGCDRMLRTERHKLLWGEPSFDRRSSGRLHLDKPVEHPTQPRALFDLGPIRTRSATDRRRRPTRPAARPARAPPYRGSTRTPRPAPSRARRLPPPAPCHPAPAWVAGATGASTGERSGRKRERSGRRRADTMAGAPTVEQAEAWRVPRRSAPAGRTGSGPDAPSWRTWVAVDAPPGARPRFSAHPGEGVDGAPALEILLADDTASFGKWISPPLPVRPGASYRCPVVATSPAASPNPRSAPPRC